MIKKINDNAYFVINTNSYFTQIVSYDPNVSSQTICAIHDFDEADLQESDVDDVEKITL